MLHAFYNRTEVRERGALAAKVIPQMCSWDAVLRSLFVKLQEIKGGDLLWMSYTLAQREAPDGSR